MYRTHNCGELRKSDVGKDVRLSGWIHSVRDHGGVIFIDLRDHYGLTQVVIDPERVDRAAPVLGLDKGGKAALIGTIIIYGQRRLQSAVDKETGREILVSADAYHRGLADQNQYRGH